MPAKLSDIDFIERTRRQNRQRAERQRQRLAQSGKTALTVWIPANLRTALTQRAAENGLTIRDTATALLSAAMECEPAKPVDNQSLTAPDTETRNSSLKNTRKAGRPPTDNYEEQVRQLLIDEPKRARSPMWGGGRLGIAPGLYRYYRNKITREVSEAG